MKNDVKAALRGKAHADRIAFESVELLWKILSPKRQEILEAMTKAGPLTIRETARRVGRDVKAVHTDVRALLAAGILERTEEGRILFPYDAVRVEFTLKAA
jgi:predicted transcriptional regulator